MACPCEPLLTANTGAIFWFWGAFWWTYWQRRQGELYLWVGIHLFLRVRKEASVWVLTDPSCHLLDRAKRDFSARFSNFDFKRQSCLASSLKCQRINVKAWEVVLQGVAWAGEGGEGRRGERRTQPNPPHKDSNLVLWYLREKKTELFITWKMETGYRGMTGLGMGAHMPVFAW